MVYQWNYTAGNQPDPEYPTLRAALDRASTTHPIELQGNDGHHGAYNSAALALAKNKDGVPVGLSKATIARDFPQYRAFIAVDGAGEPNGAVTEDARYTMEQVTEVYQHLDPALKAPEKITQRLAASGITGALDAVVAAEGQPVYDALFARHQMTARFTLAQFHDPEKYKRPDGSVDYDAMVAKAQAIRAKYAGNPLIKADTVKLFADGVLEGNPYAVPPTLPDSPSLNPICSRFSGATSRVRRR